MPKLGVTSNPQVLLDKEYGRVWDRLLLSLGLAAVLTLPAGISGAQTVTDSIEPLRQDLPTVSSAGSLTPDVASLFFRDSKLDALSLRPVGFGGYPPHQPYAKGENAAPPPRLSPRVELFAGYAYLPELDQYRVGSQPGHGWAVALNVNLRRHWGFVIDVDGTNWTTRGSLNSVDLGSLQCPLGGYGCSLRGDEHTSLSYFSFGPRVQLQIHRLTAFGLGAMEVQRSRYSEQDLASVGRADDAEFIKRVGTRPQNYSYTRPYVYNTWDRPLERYGSNIVGRARMADGSAGAWGFGIGGGADVSLSRRIGIRLVQVNYSFGGFGEGPGRQLRIKTGVVFKFP